MWNSTITRLNWKWNHETAPNKIFHSIYFSKLTCSNKGKDREWKILKKKKDLLQKGVLLGRKLLMIPTSKRWHAKNVTVTLLLDLLKTLQKFLSLIRSYFSSCTKLAQQQQKHLKHGITFRQNFLITKPHNWIELKEQLINTYWHGQFMSWS